MVDPRRRAWSRPGLAGRRRCPASTNCSIHQSLTLRADEGAISARHVFISGLDSIRIAKIEFAQIAVQVGLAHMLIDAVNAALEDAEIALNGVGVVGAENVFLGAMIDHATISAKSQPNDA